MIFQICRGTRIGKSHLLALQRPHQFVVVVLLAATAPAAFLENREMRCPLTELSRYHLMKCGGAVSKEPYGTGECEHAPVVARGSSSGRSERRETQAVKSRPDTKRGEFQQRKPAEAARPGSLSSCAIGSNPPGSNQPPAPQPGERVGSSKLHVNDTHPQTGLGS